MNDVQGIGYISQEFANYGSPFICRFSGGTQVNKDREKNNGCLLYTSDAADE